jgi:dipeptidyl aminopeptidase/acylaminoacyl peptidase
MDTLSIDQILAMRPLGGAEAPAWAPDGSQIAWISALGGQAAIWSVAPDGGPLSRLSATSLGGGGLLTAYQLQWSPDGGALAYASDSSGVDEVWLWEADGGGERQLTRLGARVEAFSWSPDGQHLAVAANATGSFAIYLVARADGRTTRLTHGPNYAVYPSFTPAGDRLLYVRLDEAWVNHEVVSIALDGSDERVVLRDEDFFDYHYGRSFGYPQVGAEGRLFCFRSQRSGWTNIWLGPVDGQGEARALAAAEADQSDPAWSPDGRQIAYVENHNGTLELKVTEVGSGATRSLVRPEVGVCGAPAWSPDGRQVAFLLGTPTSPTDLWVVEVGSGAARALTRSALGGGVARRLAEPEKVRYRSFDGLEVSAYLYGPRERGSGVKYPGLLWIHGGPTSQFMDSFQPQVQYFVQQGYVVLLPNVRGSSGYGRAFEDLNNGDWGHGDLKDAVAGAEYLKSLSYVDGEHIGITGVSYGGRMSMYATVFAPGVFQAAVAASGYNDVVGGHLHQEIRHQKMYDYELGKLPEAEPARRRASSIFFTADAGTPCFVLHGAGKYPGATAAREFAEALERDYKPFWYKAYQGENYYVASPANVRRMLLDMRAFFDFYLKGLPHNLPDDGARPLTHLSGVTGGATGARSAPPQGAAGYGVPPADMAN